ncbi:MAG: hypothetical protein ACXAEU_05455 [Candidatus Hodarchaeales archaeon]
MNKKRCAICGHGSKDFQKHISHVINDHGIKIGMASNDLLRFIDSLEDPISS